MRRLWDHGAGAPASLPLREGLLVLARPALRRIRASPVPMKRSELRRKTPLARSTTPMKRSRIRAKPRPPEDRVTGTLHAHVLARDGMCIGILLRELARTEPADFGDMAERVPWHECATRFGDRHAADDLSKLTVDHFWHEVGGRKGDRAPSRPEHMVAACGQLNDHGMTKAIREGERRWIEWRLARNIGV